MRNNKFTLSIGWYASKMAKYSIVYDEADEGRLLDSEICKSRI